MLELAFELAHNMFKAASIFYTFSTGLGDVIALGNPSKERHNWKGKVEAMEMRCSTLKKELVALQEEVKVINSRQEERKVNGSSFVLAARVTKLKDFLKDEDKRCQVASNSFEDKTCQVEELQKTLLHLTKTCDGVLKALQNEVPHLKQALCDSLQWTMLVMLSVCEP